MQETEIPQPSPRTFTRLIYIITAALAFGSLAQAVGVAQGLGIAIQSSLTWLAGVGALVLLGLASLALFIRYSILDTRTSNTQYRIPNIEYRVPNIVALLLISLSLLIFPLIFSQPFIAKLFGDSGFIRLLVLWLLALPGMFALRRAWPAPTALAATLLLQIGVILVASYLPNFTDYPFAMGWSETSRFYFPSLFLSEKIYGQPHPWPILHPSLHLLLLPPYFFDAPLWVHRAWQVILRFGMVGLIAPALLSRFEIPNRPLKWFAGLWVFIFLFNLPLYLHLPLMVFPLLWLFRRDDDRRTWLLVIALSVWAGLSRLNWYPMPGMIAAILWLLEDDGQKPLLPRLWKPAAWVIAGTGIAYAVAQGYIALSGVDKTNFFTSITSDLLWYRLFPNETYWLGVLPGILLASLPLWLMMSSRAGLWRSNLYIALLALVVLFVGGIFVSMKIGGGADIHNMDAYAVALLIVAAYAFFKKSQNQEMPYGHDVAKSPNSSWLVIALLVLIPAWFAQWNNTGLVRYDKAASQATLTAIQRRVDAVNAQGGEILFITQRHLISMHMLQNVTLIPEYEREDLMEMAMANNTAYLERFASDLEARRFAAIIVDPLKFNLLGSNYAMGEENNAWARRVVKPILCFYQEDEVFSRDKIVIYVPRAEKACPKSGE